jgi:hypothetical protein
MVIPITFPKTAQFRRPQGQAITDCNQIPYRDRNLERATSRVKQKSRASADFLGVLAIPQKVVGGCCIPTTNLTDICAC